MKLSNLIECPVCGVKKRYKLDNVLITKCKYCNSEIVIKKVSRLKTYSVGRVERCLTSR